MLHVANPFNKLDLARLPVEEGITLADQLLFGDVTAVGKKERTIPVQKFLEALFPGNLRLSAVVAESAIALDDHIVFVDNSAPAPKERKSTLAEVIAAITPTLVSSITPTGVMVAFAGGVAPSGWLLTSGLTIGGAISGATARANADTLPLYTQLWATYANTQLPIQDSAGTPSVRGSTAAADYATGKRLPLPDLRGRVIVGVDNMGGIAANRVTLAGAGIDGSTNGCFGGSQVATLAVANLPSHTHTLVIPTGGGGTGSNTTLESHAQSGTSTITSDSTGGGNPFSVTQPSLVATYIIKL